MIRSAGRLREIFSASGPRRKIGLALAALAIFDLLVYLFAIGPLADSDRERALLAAQLERQLAERKAHVQKLASTVEKVEKARREGETLIQNITLPRRTAFSAIVSELDQAAKQAGVEIRERGYNVEPVEGSDTLSMMTVTVGLEGAYENLVRFLNLLDRSPRFLIVESLGAAPQQSASATLNISIKLDAFVRET